MSTPPDFRTFDVGQLTGPILLFGGAYSNLQALTALRSEAERRAIPPRNIICTGDTPGYCADPEACLDLIEDWGIHAIAGNVESNLVSGASNCGCGFGEGSRCDTFSKRWFAFAAANISARNRNYLAQLPDLLRFTYDGKRIATLHGSPRDQSEFIWPSTSPELKLAFCNQLNVDAIIGGHCGLPFQQHIDRPTNSGTVHWINPGVIGMPANDGTPRTWFATLQPNDGLRATFYPLHYDHPTAKTRMLDDRRLPVSYAATLSTGIWDNTEIMPPAEANRQGQPFDPQKLSGTAPKTIPPIHPLPSPPQRPSMTPVDHPYSDPKNLKSFGNITKWQEEMGNKFFDYYSTVTEGDSALTEREKSLIALAVSHALQCSYCIDAYTTNSLQSGADEEQMMEAAHVAAAIKAGSTLIYARQMQRQVEKVMM